MTAGERLRLAREAAGLSIEQVVRLIAAPYLAPAFIKAMETDRVASMDVTLLADIYGVSTAWLVDGIPNDLPGPLLAALDRLVEHSPEDAAIVRAFAERMRARSA